MTSATHADTVSKAPRIVFMGTAEFGVPALRALHERFGVSAVVTIPDKPVGRGQQLQASAVKIAAEQCGIAHILQPDKLSDLDFINALQELQPEVICVIAFRILPRTVYTLASRAAFNIHASLLPKYRGAAPINHAIMNAERESGVSAFVLNDVVDTGNVLLQKRCPISENMTAGELYAALMPLGAEAAVASVEMIVSGDMKLQAQDDSQASPAPKVWREHSAIDWEQSAERVRHFIHGLSPSPCAWTLFNNERVKIYRALASEGRLGSGEWQMRDGHWFVGCADGCLEITEVQMPGKARTQVRDFLRGWRRATDGHFNQ